MYARAALSSNCVLVRNQVMRFRAYALCNVTIEPAISLLVLSRGSLLRALKVVIPSSEVFDIVESGKWNECDSHFFQRMMHHLN